MMIPEDATSVAKYMYRMHLIVSVDPYFVIITSYFDDTGHT